MAVIKEFREFAMRGSVVDLAIGVVIGAGFGKIVSSLVADILMPPVGKVLGDVNFQDLFISLDPAKTAGLASLAQAKQAGAAVIAYGAFLNAMIDFTIVALCIFLVIKTVNTMRQAPAPAEPAPTKECPLCISVIPLRATRCAHCTAEVR